MGKSIESSCNLCEKEKCTPECFNAHPGSMIALGKLLSNMNKKAYIINQDERMIIGKKR